MEPEKYVLTLTKDEMHILKAHIGSTSGGNASAIAKAIAEALPEPSDYRIDTSGPYPVAVPHVSESW